MLTTLWDVVGPSGTFRVTTQSYNRLVPASNADVYSTNRSKVAHPTDALPVVQQHTGGPSFETFSMGSTYMKSRKVQSINLYSQAPCWHVDCWA